jgi:hypothetical protein
MATNVSAALAWCVKPPKIDRADALGQVVWLFETDQLIGALPGGQLPTGTYDPVRTIFSWNGVEAVEWVKGTMIEVEYNEDLTTLVVGTDGVGTTVKNANRSGRITITLKSTSPTNQLWSALIAPSLIIGAPLVKGPFSLDDSNV